MSVGGVRGVSKEREGLERGCTLGGKERGVRGCEYARGKFEWVCIEEAGAQLLAEGVRVRVSFVLHNLDPPYAYVPTAVVRSLCVCAEKSGLVRGVSPSVVHLHRLLLRPTLS